MLPLCLFNPHPLQAQIIPDQTLPINSQVTANGNNIVIEGGTTAGNNLFHSFESFSLTNSNQAIFNSASAIDNIISRITGKSISNIDGVIKVNSNANLLFLNPNGIIFGPNSSLDMGGSFLASTAVGVQFQDGSVLNTTNSQSPPLLTISRPTGLQFNGTQSGQIMVQGTLAVPPSQTLALVGRNVEFNSGTAIAESGRLEVGSVRQGSVTLSPSKIGWHLRYNQVQAFSDIQLLSESALLNPNVVSNPFGGIQIQGRHIRLSQSEVRAQMLADQPGADINVQASQSLEIGGEVDSFFPFSSWIANVVETNANGNGGSIKINVPKVSLLDGGRIQTLSLGNGSAGNVQVKADTLSLNGGASPIMNTRRELGDSLNSQISSSNFSNGVGGNVTITAHSLSLTNGGRIGTLVGPSASSQGGNVDVTISKSIFGKEVNPFQRDSGSGITTFTFGNGNAGQINVSTQQLSLRAGGQISSRSLNFPFGNQGFSPGTGNAGNVDVQANQSIHLQGASRLSPDIISFLGSINNGTGKGSDVSVTTPQLTVAEGASVSSAVFSFAASAGVLPPGVGKGAGGNLTINAANSITVIGINSSPFNPSPSILGTFTLGQGNAGDTTINTRRLAVLDGGQVNTGTLASGNAGRLFINASESVLVKGRASNDLPAQIASNTLVLNEATRNVFFLPSQPTGNTGEVTIQARQITLTDGGRIGVQHIGSGNAGELSIQADSLFLNKQGAIIAETASGEGGNLDLMVKDILRLRNNSLISTESEGLGNGGNININTQFLIASPFENSDIIANAFDGDGGNITISTQGIFGFASRDTVTPFSDITASSQQGINGVIKINSPEVDPSQSLVELPAVVPPLENIAQGCRPGQTLGGSSFTHIGRGGLPSGPGRYLTPHTVWQDLRPNHSAHLSPVHDHAKNSAMVKSPIQIVEAKGWTQDAQGRIHLTAQTTSSRTHGTGC
ncbi:filamentous hemagglutinin N-terminal domain-containing protein [Acaryochloris sp. CCMEE 5410]|uniref:two-partner secretion domain-containing protein n=1 Tax=Acaryochloris sp. CCMEE 5410 TaxID=310037 RepID=UPI0002483C8D|nr:filamentous hemagglutinin N-terminal domain-containing protein [Acaryochloris sp. CCMEE 5410]KAI9131869.1 S-layer family protein [Acaryochloris sp. CCMEE 5410]